VIFAKIRVWVAGKISFSALFGPFRQLSQNITFSAKKSSNNNKKKKKKVGRSWESNSRPQPYQALP
jgi:hypothetical protein